jgi:hypothetical protein
MQSYFIYSYSGANPGDPGSNLGLEVVHNNFYYHYDYHQRKCKYYSIKDVRIYINIYNCVYRYLVDNENTPTTFHILLISLQKRVSIYSAIFSASHVVYI